MARREVEGGAQARISANGRQRSCCLRRTVIRFAWFATPQEIQDLQLVTFGPVRTTVQRCSMVRERPGGGRREESEDVMSLHENSHEFPSQTAVPGIYWDEEAVNPEFMRSFPSSVWDERALAHIDQHLAVEAKAASSYEALAKTEDPAVRYLAGLIAEDEQRHHQVLAKIAAALRAEVDDVAVPTHHVELSAAQRKELLDEARRLIEMEEADATALKGLRHELRSAPEETMWPVLVQMMSLDTDKHVHLLKAIERHLGGRYFAR
jgi:rubrerythrin